MSRRAKKRRGAALAAAAVLAVPLMGAAALRTAVTGITMPALTAEETAAQEYTESAEPAEPADKPVRDVPKAVFSVDDRDMLSRGDPNVPNSSDEERAVPDDGGPQPYPKTLENHDGTITAVTYGYMSGDSFTDLTAGQVRNLTDVPEEQVLGAAADPPVLKRTDGPAVLIVHTHATESYEPYRRDFYDSGWNSRTTDSSMNMIAVGDAIAKELEAAGVGVLHDTTLHDYPSYNGSYDLSRETVRRYLEEYPSIQVVLDVHRDAIERDSGERIAPTAEIGGRSAAQVMIICGCDDGTMDMPDYMENLRFGCMLQTRLESDWPGLTRPLLFDYRKYNQDLSPCSVLIEVGGHANSIDQAVYSGELIGKSLSELIKN